MYSPVPRRSRGGHVAPSLGRNIAACGAVNPCNAVYTTVQPGVTITGAPTAILLVAPNSVFEDRLSQLDLRLTKILRFGRTRVQGMFDIYNVFNAAAVLATNGAYGPAFLRPASVMGGRTFKFGGQLDF